MGVTLQKFIPYAVITCDGSGCEAFQSFPFARHDRASARRAASELGWARRRRNCGLTAHYIDLCPECDRQYRLTCAPDTERSGTPPRP